MLKAEEITGEGFRPQPRKTRLVKNLGIAAGGRTSKKARIREKNRRYQAKLRANPELRKDRSEYLKAWRARNAERMKVYRRKWLAENAEQHRVYQREWRRRRYNVAPEDWRGVRG